jgi:hypothetical protein
MADFRKKPNDVESNLIHSLDMKSPEEVAQFFGTMAKRVDGTPTGTAETGAVDGQKAA